MNLQIEVRVLKKIASSEAKKVDRNFHNDWNKQSHDPFSHD